MLIVFLNKNPFLVEMTDNDNGQTDANQGAVQQVDEPAAVPNAESKFHETKVTVRFH